MVLELILSLIVLYLLKRYEIDRVVYSSQYNSYLVNCYFYFIILVSLVDLGAWSMLFIIAGHDMVIDLY